MNNHRYTVFIMLKKECKFLEAWDFKEQVKSMASARSYKCLIDDSVMSAHVFDNLTKKIVETWK